jgi:hypothetical protein
MMDWSESWPPDGKRMSIKVETIGGNQVGIPILSIGALMMAVKLESTIWLVVISWPPRCPARRWHVRGHTPPGSVTSRRIRRPSACWWRLSVEIERSLVPNE